MSSATFFLLATTLGGSPNVDGPTVEQVREAVRRSIPYIEQKGAWWIREKKCVSCHRVGTMVWSLNAARQRGFSVSNRLDGWFDWAIEKSLAKNNRGKIVGASNKDGLAQLLLAGDIIAGKPDRVESYKRLASVIASDLQRDGTWQPGGQLPSQKRRKSETTAVTTMWLALALASQGPEGNHRAELDKSLKYIAATPPGESTEWYVARLLLAQRLGDDETTATMVKKLRGQQQPDGGWGWVVGENSDALGTGMAVYALLRANVGRDDDATKRALRFLFTTQQNDGSWIVKGTKANKRDDVAETAVYWGTTWAVLALAESLPG